jgi:hypothetical protein
LIVVQPSDHSDTLFHSGWPNAKPFQWCGEFRKAERAKDAPAP